MGPDELSAKLLIEVQNEIAYPLLLLFKKSLKRIVYSPGHGSKRTSHQFLKRAVETPLKTIDQLVLQAKCKLFETIMRDAFVHYLENNHLILDSQHGF